MGSVNICRLRPGIFAGATVVLVLAMAGQNVVEGQPQVYFKSSQLSLPAKSIPRIGRRSEGIPSNPTWYDSSYFHPERGGSPSDNFPFYKDGQGSWQDESPYGGDDALLSTPQSYRKFLAPSFKLHRK